MLTQSRLKELLHYCPDTGVFTRLTGNNRVKVGSIAGCLAGLGYSQIRIDRKKYYSHRLAFLYIEGAFPKNNTDHINGVKADNRWSNLRAVTQAENLRNQKKRNTNTSGIMGVHRHKGKWVAQIKVGGKLLYLGFFADFFEACCARKSIELKYGYHPNHGRTS